MLLKGHFLPFSFQGKEENALFSTLASSRGNALIELLPVRVDLSINLFELKRIFKKMMKPEQHNYKAWILIALIIGYIIGVALLFGSFGVGLFILFCEIGGIMVYDWQGVLTLRGKVKKEIMQKDKLVNTGPGYFLLYLFFPYIMLPIYLVNAFRDYRQAEQSKPLEMRRQIANIEAQLGILPATEGTCRVCKKPLQIGAEFCPYCGETVVERPKVCPNCATTTFADARWCPNCRTALDSM